MKSEPAVIVTLISALVGLAVAFGAPISNEQMGAIMAVVTVISGLVIRSQVYPQKSVDEIKAEPQPEPRPVRPRKPKPKAKAVALDPVPTKEKKP